MFLEEVRAKFRNKKIEQEVPLGIERNKALSDEEEEVPSDLSLYWHRFHKIG